jgi:hypothetical protein
MTKATDIEPALTAEQWAEVLDGSAGSVGLLMSESAECMARANHYLPDNDPRKITRADVDQLRRLNKAWLGFEFVGLIPRLADRLAALLPPE